ncbi:hypothetical protein D3C87_1020180 [compost metagenome]
MGKMIFLVSFLVASAATAESKFPFTGFYAVYTITGCVDKEGVSDYCKFNTLTIQQTVNTRNGAPDNAMDLVLTDNKQGRPGARYASSINHPNDTILTAEAKYDESKDRAYLFHKTIKMTDGSVELMEMEITRDESGIVTFTSKKSKTPDGGKEISTKTVMTLTKKK